MCLKKVRFNTKKKAGEVAERYSQRVYECPICMGFHLTSKEDWRDEFVCVEKYQRLLNLYEEECKNKKGKLKKLATQVEKHKIHVQELSRVQLKCKNLRDTVREKDLIIDALRNFIFSKGFTLDNVLEYMKNK